MDHLLPCPGCTRHVRAADSLCPFCGEALPLSLRGQGPKPLPPRRLGRAGTFAFGAALAASACGGTTHGADTGVAQDAGSGTDSGALVDSGPAAVDSGPADAGVDSGGIAPAYGVVPVDAGPPTQDSGGIAPAYGDVPADAGPPERDSGGIAPLYGVPG